jgi:phosphomannomutase/phosphoglucomutase|tara:strand:- start:5720 stop:6007 length:288 start_codon:yes stop_codon:yes gene_type:complete
MAYLHKDLPKTWATPTMSPYCPDEEKYDVLDRLVLKLTQHFNSRGKIAGLEITDIITVNGARIILSNGAWGLVRASSNTPNLVVVCESSESENEM